MPELWAEMSNTSEICGNEGKKWKQRLSDKASVWKVILFRRIPKIYIDMAKCIVLCWFFIGDSRADSGKNPWKSCMYRYSTFLNPDGCLLSCAFWIFFQNSAFFLNSGIFSHRCVENRFLHPSTDFLPSYFLFPSPKAIHFLRTVLLV